MSILKSISWTFGSRMGAQITQIIFSIFLARLLTPAEYGLIGMLTVLSGFALTIGEAGLNSALVYLEKADDKTFSTAFWMQLSVNIFFMISFFLASGQIAEFYGQPLLKPLTQLMSVTFILQSIGSIQTAILSRQMKFKAISIANFSATFLSSVCGLILAVRGYGVWALAWMSIVNVLALMIGTSIASGWWPRLSFSVSVAKQMTNYSAYLLLNNCLNYWLRNGDNLLIGRALGAIPLGIYNRAYTLMLLPLQNVNTILGQVMFPTLSRARSNMIEFRRLYIQSIGLIALVTFPIMGGLSVLGHQFIMLLYGAQWEESAPVLQILSLVGLFQCIIFPVGWIYNSLGHNKDQFVITLILCPMFIALITVGLRYGLLGVTWGYAIWAVISGILNMYAAGRLISVSVIDYLGLVRRKAVATLVMMVAVNLVVLELSIRLGSVGGLFSCVGLGAIVYGLVLFLLRDPDLTVITLRLRPLVVRTLLRRSA